MKLKRTVIVRHSARIRTDASGRIRRRFVANFVAALLAMTAVGGWAESDELSVKAEVDRAFMTIGDRVHFRVTVAHAEDIRVLGWDAREALKDFEIKEEKDFSQREGNRVIEGKDYLITSYALGEFVIRPFPIRYRNPQDENRQIETNSLYLAVQSVDENKKPDSDIRGVKGVSAFKGSVWFWLILVPFLAAGIGVLVRRLFLGPNKMINASQEPPLSPHDEAYQALNRLRHSDLLQKGDLKGYFFEMSEIIRRYFERRYQLPALESTTHELLIQLSEKVSSDDLKLISEVLELCDLAKFAKYAPPPAEVLRQNQQAKLIIDRTRETAQAPPLQTEAMNA